ncbi:DUF6408 family protein [Streptomyces sp. HC307]|uniref:DUF6408 family protein n=1 Tax=Streptomyces flavusporus TaxID=3385496 RepID=UPI003916DA6F
MTPVEYKPSRRTWFREVLIEVAAGVVSEPVLRALVATAHLPQVRPCSQSPRLWYMAALMATYVAMRPCLNRCGTASTQASEQAEKGP